MKYITDEKLVIVGAAGMIGSNMAQTALMLRLTPNVCLYDVYEPGLRGVVAEMDHCAFEGANITWTTDPAVAFKDAKYIISSGGAPRKEGMTREEAAQAAVDAVKALSIKVGIPQHLSELGIKEEDLPKLAASAIRDVCTPGNPREVTEEIILDLYRKVL